MNPDQQQPVAKPHHKRLIVLGVVALVVICIGMFLVLRPAEDADQTSTGSVTPEMQRVQACLKSKNVSAEDWAAYQKAANECQSQ